MGLLMRRGSPDRRALGIAVAVSLLTLPSAYAQEETADERKFTIAPTGYVQLDLRTFPDWDVTPGTGRLNRSTVEVRRARAGVEGGWRGWSFELSIDPQDDDGVFVKDAYTRLRVNRALRIRVGQFKIPGSRDYDTSARRLDFLERTPLTDSLAVRRDIGASVDGRYRAIGYDVGLFAGDGTGRDERAGLTVAGRVTWRMIRNVEIGGSVSEGKTTAVDSEEANGLEGRAPSGYRFLEGVYVQGHRFRVGADIEWSPGPWRVLAEALRVRDDRLQQGLDYEDLPPAIGSGLSVSMHRRLQRRLEAGLRYDYLGFDDAGNGSAADSVRPRATNIRARASHAWTFGSTWQVTPWLRLLEDVELERYSERRSAPESGRPGTYVTLATRLQLEWP